jgi:hypothetical protein
MYFNAFAWSFDHRSSCTAQTHTHAAGFVTYVRVLRYRNIGAGVFIGKGA